MLNFAKRHTWALVIASLAGTALAANFANVQNPLTLQQIVQKLEAVGYTVVEVKFDDLQWEVDAYQNGLGYELDVDPQTGNVTSTHRDDIDPMPPAKALLLSKILEQISGGANSIQVLSAEFEHGRWEIDLRRDGQKRELRVDPLDGKVLADHRDD